MEDMYMSEPSDLEKLNISLIKWMEEAVGDHPDSECLAIPNLAGPGSEEEEDSHSIQVRHRDKQKRL